MRQANVNITGNHALSNHTAEMWYKDLFQEEAEIALREPFDDVRIVGVRNSAVLHGLLNLRIVL